MSIKLMLVASTPEAAIEAQDAGVDRLFFDLEYINKAERQSGRNTLILHNDIEDIPAIRKALGKTELLVRVNALHSTSRFEIDTAISYGADLIMLPMVVDREEVELLVKYVDGRAKVVPMIETAAALARLDDILDVKGIDELYIGLNDLHTIWTPYPPVSKTETGTIVRNVSAGWTWAEYPRPMCWWPVREHSVTR